MKRPETDWENIIEDNVRILLDEVIKDE